MSLKEREEAKDIVAAILARWGTFQGAMNNRDLANHILNQLLKFGYLNDKVTVQADEVFDQLEQAAFKCKVEE